MQIWKSAQYLRLHMKIICLFANIQKQQNMLKISLLFKKFTIFAGKELENS